MLAKCVGPSKVEGLPWCMKRSKTKMTDIMNNIINTAFSFNMKPMQSLYDMLNKNSFLVIAVLILGSFILLFPYGRFNRSQKALQSLISDSINHNSINIQQFWETREFYSPGHIILNKQAQEPDAFLTFTSDWWHSSEVLTQMSKLPVDLSDECDEVLLMTQQDLICNLQD